MNNDCDDDEGFERFYENGHWEWDDVADSLVFINNFPETLQDFSPTPHNIASAIEFKEDLDFIEQQRFRKKIQRKYMDNDRVCLQDVKDLACFTAPKAILTPSVINILHMPMTERFIRALLLYCQYYLQVADEMSKRILDLEVMVRTPTSDGIELQLRENLEDLRLVVAKEYASMILGSGDVAKYHHMGISKKQRSLSKRDSVLFESLMRICIQIIWLALGRISYNQLELEISRLLKSEMYNIIEHKIHTKYTTQRSQRELFVLLGHCVRRNRMTNAFSPLHNEMQRQRATDFRLFGLGVIQYPTLSHRLRYIERALTAPESQFEELKVSLGILGLQRARFDTMLNEIKMPLSTTSSTSTSRQSMGRMASASRTSRVSTSMRKSAIQHKLFDDIYLPEDDEEECLPHHFPTKVLPKNDCDQEQRRKWMSYIKASGGSKRLKVKKTLMCRY